jgi:hypothetical protein
MLGKLVRLIRPGQSATSLEHPLLPRILAAVGNDITMAANFAEQLIPAAEKALSFFSNQIAEIPGPLELAAKGLDQQELLNALFVEPGEIDRAFGRSLAVKEELPGLLAGECEEAYALLAVRRRRGSAPSTVPPYADHTLRSLSASLVGTREKLAFAAFDRLLLDFAEHVGKLRRKDRMLAIEWEWNLQHDAQRVMTDDKAPEYVYAAKELTPENQLHGLLTWLESPSCFLRLQATADGNQTGPLELPLLKCSDRREWQVCLVSFSSREAGLALHNETHNHRYILI